MTQHKITRRGGPEKVEQPTHPLVRVIIYTWRCAGLVAHDGIHLTMVGGNCQWPMARVWHRCNTGATTASVSLGCVVCFNSLNCEIHG